VPTPLLADAWAAAAGAKGGGRGRRGGGALLRGHTALVSSLHPTPAGTPDLLTLTLGTAAAGLADALFYAAYSLTEAPLKVRNQLRPTIRKFGTIFVAYTNKIQHFDNDKWIRQWIDEDLRPTHTVCVWKAPDRQDIAARTSYLVVASLKGRPPVACRLEFGCEPATRHRKIACDAPP
jgi:hypothetical protein